ncbi:MAG: NUDIX hydrolase [Christensenellales bacterium]|jgi:8-oxo-dGTP diphosphatase
MQGYNLIMVYSPDRQRLLMCRRTKEPYLGLDNLPGGKIERGEAGLDAAYRELAEETGITQTDIALKTLMTFDYPWQGCYVEVYVGQLVHPVNLRPTEHPLYWSDLEQDFFDTSRYAGEGNIGHMVEQVRLYAQEIFS